MEKSNVRSRMRTKVDNGCRWAVWLDIAREDASTDETPFGGRTLQRAGLCAEMLHGGV